MKKDPNRPRTALDVAAWIHSEGGGRENLESILSELDALRKSLRALKLFDPSIENCFDALRPLERYLKGRIRHLEGLNAAFEAENWRLDPAKPGGGERIGKGHIQKSLLVGYVQHLCEELNITSYGKDAQDQVLAILPPVYRDRPRVKEAIANYLKPSHRKCNSPPKPPKSA